MELFLGWIYDVCQSYEPAFYMAGACTILSVCLLFLVPFLLPPEVRAEWSERSNIPSTDSSLLRKPTSGTQLAKESLKSEKEHGAYADDEKKNELKPLVGKSVRKSFIDSLEYIPQKNFSLPNVVTWEDCVLSNVFNFTEDSLEHLTTSRETYI